MQRVALLYNPASGQYRQRREAVIAAMMAALAEAGIKATALATTSQGSAGQQVREVIADGYDTVLACGGDGTIHEALQALVGTEVALGVIPMGTANALAADLGLPRNPVRALRRLLKAKPVELPVGRITYTGKDGESCSRYFTVAAGVGADAHLMYRLDSKLKQRFGYALYLWETLRLWLSYGFPFFEARILKQDSTGEWQRFSQLLMIRIHDFGGVLHNVIPGAALSEERLHLLGLRTRSRFRLIRYSLAVILGRHAGSRLATICDAERVECRPLPGARIFVEADGEPLGELPATFEVVPHAVRLLMLDR